MAGLTIHFQTAKSAVKEATQQTKKQQETLKDLAEFAEDALKILQRKI